MPSFPHSSRARWSAVLLSALLAACGGGGSDGGGNGSGDTGGGGSTPTPEPEPTVYSLTLDVSGLPDGGQIALVHGGSEYPLAANGNATTLSVSTGDTLQLSTPAFGTQPTTLFDCILADSGNGTQANGILTLTLEQDASQSVRCAAAQIVPAYKTSQTQDPINLPNGIGLLRVNPLAGTATWLTDANGQPLSAHHSILSFNLTSLALTPSSALFDGKLYFPAFTDEFGSEIWRTDGTDSGTQLLKDIRTGGATQAAKAGVSNTVPFASIGDGKLYFLAQPQGVGRLYETDGTEAGTQLLEPDTTKPGSGTIYSLLTAGSKLFIIGTLGGANNVVSLLQLANSAGERGLTVLANGSEGSVSTLLLANAGEGENAQVFFARKQSDYANTENNAYWLWRTDGSPEGTRRVSADVEYFHQNQGIGAIGADGALYFTGKTTAAGYELWRSDGTDAGTQLLHEIGLGAQPAVATEAPKNITPVGNNVYFTGYDAEHGRELWLTDGTDAGTELVQDIFPGPGAGASNAGVPASINPAADALVFSTSATGTAPQDLWAANGATAAKLIPDDDARQDIAKDNTLFTRLNDGRLMFVHTTVDGSRTTHEFWLTDGTAAGTTPLLDASTGQALTTVIE